MARDLNQVFLIGRLTNDVEVKFTSSGMQVCSFSIANNDVVKQNDVVSYFKIQAWGKLAEVCGQYLKKGNQIAIIGTLKQSRWKDKEGNNKSDILINAESIQFIGSNEKKSNTAAMVNESINGQESNPWDET